MAHRSAYQGHLSKHCCQDHPERMDKYVWYTWYNYSLDTASKPSIPFIQELRHRMARLKYTLLRQQQTVTFIPQHLRNCKYVFVWNDAVRKPLTLAYQGPFKVIRHSNKYITIRYGDTTDTVSIDRIKPAFSENQQHHGINNTSIWKYSNATTSANPIWMEGHLH